MMSLERRWTSPLPICHIVLWLMILFSVNTENEMKVNIHYHFYIQYNCFKCKQVEMKSTCINSVYAPKHSIHKTVYEKHACLCAWSQGCLHIMFVICRLATPRGTNDVVSRLNSLDPFKDSGPYAFSCAHDFTLN